MGLLARMYTNLLTKVFVVILLSVSVLSCGSGGGGGSEGGSTASVIGVSPESPFNPASSAQAESLSIRYRINAGGSAFVDNQGNQWQADGYFNTGGSDSIDSSINIIGTANDLLYQTQRNDNSSANPKLTYSLPVINGNYTIKLHFAENFSGNFGAGLRVFDILAENQILLDNVDIFSQAGGKNRALVLTFTSVAVNDGVLNIAFNHVTDNPTLAGIEVVSEDLSNLVFDFSAPDLSDWLIIDDSGIASDWQVVNGKLSQSEDLANQKAGTNPLVQSYHQGSYLYLKDYFDLRNYTASVVITPNKDVFIRDSFDGQDIGLMFRYIDNNNYYRISLNGTSSYMRLEKKMGGNYQTLAASARGHTENVDYTLQVVVNGPLIRVAVNNEVIISIYDNSIESGTVALYSQDSATFDNVMVTGLPKIPVISLGEPLAYTVLPNNTVQTSATVMKAPAGSTVAFEFGGMSCDPATESPAGSGQYIANCGSFAQGSYDQPGLALAAYLFDSSNTLIARDEHLKIGIAGDHYISIGDSITLGSFDLFASDNQSKDGRIIGLQGYHAPLSDMLTATLGIPQLISNNGVGGDSTNKMRFRTDSILDRHSSANKVLLMLGTNDANGDVDVGSYQSNMQVIINKALTESKSVWVAKIPPFLPYNDFLSKNSRAQNYNSAIDSLSGIEPGGPNFFEFFYDSANDYDRFSMYQDNLHPNALGQKVLATLWHNALTGMSVTPFYLDFLCNRMESADCSATSPTSHKQTFLATNYPRYYIDEDFEVLSKPNVLKNGIWIQTANSEFNNTDAEYLYFEVDRSVRVYVAYDAGAATLPNWLNSNYSNTGMTITTNDPNSPTLRVYSRTFSAGSVSLGGNLAAGAAGANSNYIVVVKEI